MLILFCSYHDVIKLVPIFSYKNRYIVTPKVQELYTNSALQKELVFFVVRNGWFFVLRELLYKFCFRCKGLCGIL